MSALLDEPAIVFLCFTAATVLALVEFALPTFGSAGTAALILTAVGVIAMGRQDATIWPLLPAAAAVCLWAVMIARGSAPPAQQATALALFAGGSLGFAVLTRDLFTGVLAVAETGAVATSFPTVFRVARRLIDRPAQIGRESFVGRAAEVVDWHDDRGAVRLDGTRW
ncbi:MAG: hypothetical protein ACRD0U_19210 [Acidimicrobiales bacterium]